MLYVALSVFFLLIVLSFVLPQKNIDENGKTSWDVVNRNYTGFLSKADTNFIKGIAILMIMLSHIAIELDRFVDVIGGGY